MTEKRFENVGKDIFQYGEWWCSAGGEHCADVIATAINELIEENEQLKQDNTVLMKLLENQSIIIQKFHSKLLEYQVKEPIVLKKKDLELMGKAISYYTHGRCAE